MAKKNISEAPVDGNKSAETQGGALEDAPKLNPEIVDQRIKDLEEKLAAAEQEIASLNEQLTQQDQETEDLRIKLKEAEEIAQDALTQFNDSASKAPQPFEATSTSGKKVKVNFGVHHNGKQYSAADLVEDPDAIEQLLAIGSGSITLIEE